MSQFLTQALRRRRAQAVPCPVCMHEVEMRARLAGETPIHDDPALMRWQPPYGGVRGQNITRWDGGHWECDCCEATLTARDAGVLLDAVLRLAAPDCDSIHDGLHEDVQRALAGGVP